ncbi:MAG: alpha-amylase family glycosyl hydrolase [Myxococcaceae bacterium]
MEIFMNVPASSARIACTRAALGTALLALLSACPSPQSTPFDAGVLDEGCLTTLRYRPRAAATRVGVIGEWNEFDRLAYVMSDADSDGTFEITLRAPPGAWAYAFLENGLENLDPNVTQTREFDGRKFSVLEVTQCRLPYATVKPGSQTSTRTAPGAGTFSVDLVGHSEEGAAGNPTLEVMLAAGNLPERAVSAPQFTITEDGASVRLNNLEDAGYVLKVRAVSGNNVGEWLLISFWIEEPPFALSSPPPNQPTVTERATTLVKSRTAAGQGSLSLTLALTGARLKLQGTLSDGENTRALTSEELVLSADGTSASLRLTQLKDAKYTARVRAIAGTGEASEWVRFPFWIEETDFTYFDSPLYMLMTDRFRDGDKSNNREDGKGVEPGARFMGGDLNGVEQAIREGYFDQLNVKAIWLSPWYTQPLGQYPSDDSHTVTGYHGYRPVKPPEVDPRYGGNEALKRVVREAHRRGIRIIMDAVLNHVHEQHEYFKDPAKKKWFRTDCVCQPQGACSYDNQPLTCLFAPYLPDVNWSNPEAATQFIADTLWWMEEFDLDGLRLDAVKHIEESAFSSLSGAVKTRFERARTHYFRFGETFTSDTGLIKRYMGPDRLDSQLNFPLFMSVPENVFGRDRQGLKQAQAKTQGLLADFGTAPMVNFVGNHDVARFITKADSANWDRQGSKWNNLPGPTAGQLPYDRLHMAMVNLMTIPGVPLIYYGDEYGETGGSDPDNRHFFASTLLPPQQALFNKMKRLLATRTQLRGLRRGPLVDFWCNAEPWGEGQGNLYAYSRPDSDPRQSAVVVLNLTDQTWSNVSVTFPPSMTWVAGVLEDALGQRVYTFSNSTVSVDVPARGAVLLRLQ